MTIFSDFSCLVDSNEAVPGNRGSWGMKKEGEPNIFSATCHRHYEDSSNALEKSWHTHEYNVEISPHSGSFNVESTSSHLNLFGDGKYSQSGHTAKNVLKNKINTLKKKLKHYEEEFESTFGHRPSKSEKMKHRDIKKYWRELSKARKELKQMEDADSYLGIKEEKDSNLCPAPHYKHNEYENRGFLLDAETEGPHLNCGSGENDLPTGQSSIKALKKNINNFKKKIKNFEEEFENKFGYRPSKSEKRNNKDIKKYMGELSKTHKELKQMRDSALVSDSITSAPESTTFESQSALAGQTSAGAASTLQQIEERINKERSESGRKENISEMTSNELQDEKLALQKALLHYENIYGRPKSREDRDLAKPLYDRYRQCKRYVSRAESHTRINTGDLASITEHVTMDYTLVSHQEENNDEPVPNIPTGREDALLNHSHLVDKEGKSSSLSLGDLHFISIQELKKRKKGTREEKKILQKALKVFEDQFEKEYGRKFQKEDRGPLEQTYLDYKHLKGKLKLLEALLSKHQPTR